ncbi:CRISPR-associated protein Cas4 [Desulfoluna sp.]|uniref:CRISPR-associated protein Cas4 n=1 Tax=Desulfoluna sp. TaxID=2045199 RepID=UPI002629F015|nr:CRISPR-associated protein Cas4 [Desulfoluna sp.]
MFTDDDLLPLSAVQHLLFCRRQCALIHVERLWVENRYTAEGRVLHERVDRRGERPGKGLRVVYGMDLKGLRLGLIGKADTVEFHADGSRWVPYPVEYKRGASKKGNHDRVQLCAQALCLEEMYEISIGEGALFYGKTRRREVVLFSEALRAETEKAARDLHALVASRVTPESVYTKGCETCSFLGVCMPKVTGKGLVQGYLKEITKT